MIVNLYQMTYRSCSFSAVLVTLQKDKYPYERRLEERDGASAVIYRFTDRQTIITVNVSHILYCVRHVQPRAEAEHTGNADTGVMAMHGVD